MYYSEYTRIKKMQKLLERVAYISVGTDILIAFSTYLVLTHVTFSSSLLIASDYIDFAMVGIAATMFILVILLKSRIYLARKAKMAAFRISRMRSGY